MKYRVRLEVSVDLEAPTRLDAVRAAEDALPHGWKANLIRAHRLFEEEINDSMTAEGGKDG